MPSENPIPGSCGALINKWKEKFGKRMYCTQAAGWGTEHAGSGRCKLHGGMSTGKKKSLKYLMKLVEKKERKLIEMFRELPEEERWSLENVLAIHHIVLGEVLKTKKYDLVLRLGEAIQRILETLKKDKYGSEVKVQVQVIVFFVEKVIDIFNDCVELKTVTERRNAFIRGLESALSEYSNSIIEKGRTEGRSEMLDGTFRELDTFKVSRN
jgi:hypothetical protein